METGAIIAKGTVTALEDNTTKAFKLVNLLRLINGDKLYENVCWVTIGTEIRCQNGMFENVVYNMASENVEFVVGDVESENNIVFLRLKVLSNQLKEQLEKFFHSITTILRENEIKYFPVNPSDFTRICIGIYDTPELAQDAADSFNLTIEENGGYESFLNMNEHLLVI